MIARVFNQKLTQTTQKIYSALAASHILHFIYIRLEVALLIPIVPQCSNTFSRLFSLVTLQSGYSFALPLV